MRFWTTFSRWVGGGGPPLGGDLPPVGPPAPQDNLLIGDRSLTYRDTGQTQRVVVAYSGSAQITADLWVYEESTLLWYKISSAPLVLPPNTMSFFDIAVPLSTAERIQGDVSKPGGELQAVLIPHNPGGLALGEYKFAFAPNLSGSAGGGGGGGPSTNVSIVSPIPLPVTFSSPVTSWVPPIRGNLANQGVFKSLPGIFYQVFGFNNKTHRRYFMLFDSVAVPPNTTPSWACVLVPGIGTFGVDLERPRTFLNGLCWAVSTTPDVLTLDASATFWAQVEIG